MGWAVLVRGWLPPRRVLLCMFPCGVHPAFVLAIFQRSSSCQYLPGSDLRSLSLDFSPPAHPPVVGSPSLPLLCSQIIYPNLQSLLAPATRVASLATHRWLLIGGYSSVAQRLKRLPAVWETWVRSLGRKDPLAKEMATHSSILAWRMVAKSRTRLHFHFHSA